MNGDEIEIIRRTTGVYYNYFADDSNTYAACGCVFKMQRTYKREGIDHAFDSLISYHSGGKDVTLLIPDPDRPQREDFVWCVAVDRVKFNKWYKLAERFKGVTAVGQVRYMNRFDKGQIRTIIVLPNGEQSDDDAQTACAWLRMVKGINCKIYVVRCSDDPMKGARLVSAIAGTSPEFMEEVEEGTERGTKENGEPHTT